MIVTDTMRTNAKQAWHDAAMKKVEMVKVLDPDEIIDTIAPHVQETPNDVYERALRTIAHLWPIDTTAKIGPDGVTGVNTGKSRAIIAEGAVSIARKALGIERMP